MLKSFSDLFVFKSIVDSYNIKFCGVFTTAENPVSGGVDYKNCVYSANQKVVTIYIKKEKLASKYAAAIKASKSERPKFYL